MALYNIVVNEFDTLSVTCDGVEIKRFNNSEYNKACEFKKSLIELENGVVIDNGTVNEITFNNEVYDTIQAFYVDYPRHAFIIPILIKNHCNVD